MANYNWDDCTLVYNTQTLTTYVKDVSGVKLNAVLSEFHPMGVAFPTPVDTGLRNADELTVTFQYDGGGAATPPTAAAVGTSATLTLTIGAAQTVSGTYIVSSAELTIGTDASHTYTAVFTPTGTVVWDVAA